MKPGAGGRAHGHHLTEKVRQQPTVVGAGATLHHRRVRQRAIVAEAGVGELAPEHPEDVVGDLAGDHRIEHGVELFQPWRRAAVGMADIEVASRGGVHPSGGGTPAAHADAHTHGPVRAHCFLQKRGRLMPFCIDTTSPSSFRCGSAVASVSPV